MSEYKYRNPVDDGYIKFGISSKDQNRIFKHRKSRWSINYEFYIKDGHIIMHAIPNVFGCLFCTVIFPFSLLLCGVVNYKDVYKECILRTWQCKKYGSFSGDDIYHKRDGTYESIVNAAGIDKIK